MSACLSLTPCLLVLVILLTVNNLIALNSEFYKLSHEKFLIQSLTYQLDYSGSISVTVSNIRNLPTLTKITQ